MMRAPLRALRRSFCTTSLWACGQYQLDFSCPAVDDVADQEDRVGIVVAQEVEKPLGLAAARAEMDVGEKQRANADRTFVFGLEGQRRVLTFMRSLSVICFALP